MEEEADIPVVGESHKVSSLDKELWAINGCEERENRFSPGRSPMAGCLVPKDMVSSAIGVTLRKGNQGQP